ncbi:hypothetical protein EDD18DRAFT_1109599 [Armillaria luteobubalina]|uniref:Uncharacterized protein n=1 Tax=Armillaria luteobubalina TaxID=153913 RepID=A0AA39PWI2_9AGAR|nr:hypothetical protein EDD18DRAFT_1109599 [Armillaria luteobubalina]
MPLHPTIPVLVSYNIHEFTAIFVDMSKSLQGNKEATTRLRQIQHLGPANRFLSTKFDMITSPNKNSRNERLALNFDGCRRQERKTLGTSSLSYIRCPKSLTPLNPRLGWISNFVPYPVPAITFSRLLPCLITMIVKRRIDPCSLTDPCSLAVLLSPFVLLVVNKSAVVKLPLSTTAINLTQLWAIDVGDIPRTLALEGNNNEEIIIRTLYNSEFGSTRFSRCRNTMAIYNLERNTLDSINLWTLLPILPTASTLVHVTGTLNNVPSRRRVLGLWFVVARIARSMPLTLQREIYSAAVFG